MQQLFEIGFNAPAARALCVRFKELPAVTESVAQARNLPKVCIIIRPGCSDHISPFLLLFHLTSTIFLYLFISSHTALFCDFFTQLNCLSESRRQWILSSTSSLCEHAVSYTPSHTLLVTDIPVPAGFLFCMYERTHACRNRCMHDGMNVRMCIYSNLQSSKNWKIVSREWKDTAAPPPGLPLRN